MNESLGVRHYLIEVNLYVLTQPATYYVHVERDVGLDLDSRHLEVEVLSNSHAVLIVEKRLFIIKERIQLKILVLLKLLGLLSM